MDNNECFKVFRYGWDCFGIETRQYIDYLEGLSPIEVMLDENAKIITSLLNEIYSYSLIYTFLDLDSVREESRDYRVSLYHKVEAISEACREYLCNLYEAGCDHPTVLKFNSLDSSYYTYDVLMEFLSLLSEYADDERQAVIMNFFEVVNEDILKEEDEQFLDIVNNIKNIDDEYEFINYLTEHARKIGVRKGLLMDESSYVYYGSGNKQIFRFNDSNRKDYYLSGLIYYLKTVESNNECEEIDEWLEDLENSYGTYKTLHYDYFKNSLEEAKYLTKGQKM